MWRFHVSPLHSQVTIVTVPRGRPPLPPPPTVERQAVDEVESEKERRREKRRSEERGAAGEKRGSLAIPAGRKKRRGKGRLSKARVTEVLMLHFVFLDA